MIIKYSKRDPSTDYSYLNIYPDIFTSEAKKQQPDEIKHTMDYFQNVAFQQFVRKKDSRIRNYELLKGKLRPEDFYQADPQTKSFLDNLDFSENELPTYVQHYSILNNPINEMVGEITKRPDISKVKAMDEESQSQEMQYKTEILQQYITQQARAMILTKLSQNGQEVEDDVVDQLTEEKVKDYITGYTSMAEKWGNTMLEAVKVEFNIKEKSEDSFRDLLITSEEYHHIYEDNSKMGFGYEVLNPKNVWRLSTPDKKLSKDWFANGTIHIMEISEIINRFNLSKEEIDHLRDIGQQSNTLFSPRESNFNFPNQTGENTIKYDTYDPLLEQERLFIASQLTENQDPLTDYFGTSLATHNFGYKYMVLQAYFISKKKIAKVTYVDEEGEVQVAIVDGDEYKTIPNEVSVEYGYIDQWYKGYKIGRDIYNMEPLKAINTNPIVGVIHEVKNVEAKSLVDLMKPFQIIYNVCMNQLWNLLEKEIGNVPVIQLRRIPRLKDADGQDDIDAWELEARQRGIMFEDDAVENTGTPIPNTATTRPLDLTRTNEIQSRYNLAIQMKYECWELAGFNRERFGQSIGSSQTATSIQNAVSRSYAQTEPYFVQHEYLMNEVYQTILDMALYTESQKPTSTISFIGNEGQQAFVSINGYELSLRDLKCFVTTRAADEEKFKELRLLAQPMLQNGVDVSVIAEIFTTNSFRELKDRFRRIDADKKMFMEQQQSMEQQQLQAQQDGIQMQIQAQAEEKRLDREFEAYQNELDRLNKKEVALLQQLGRNAEAANDNNGNGMADPLETVRLTTEMDKANREYEIRMREMLQKTQESADKNKIEMEKIKVARENMKNDKEIAQINARNRAKAKASSKSKK